MANFCNALLNILTTRYKFALVTTEQSIFPHRHRVASMTLAPNLGVTPFPWQKVSLYTSHTIQVLC